MVKQIRLILISFLFFLAASIQAQSIVLNAEDQPLGTVLLELKNKYDLQFSYNDALVENCIINISSTFATPSKALKKILQSCGLSYKKIGDVFLLYEKKENEYSDTTRSPLLIFKGQIVDQKDGEALPFSMVQINSTILQTDLNGHFSFKTIDSKVSLAVSHLGYFQVDTIYNTASVQRIELSPQIVGLEEVVVKAEKIKPLSRISTQPMSTGLIKVNQKIATFLPGNNSNAIFNMLRLQAGILAAGEQSKDFIIWGSYKGQTHIVFDGMTLFSASSLYDDIGSVNPLIVKDIEVHKGAYQVDIGDRVGGFVNISSFNGNKNKFGARLNLSSEIANAFVNIPIAQRAALQLSARKTYYGFYNYKLNDQLGRSDFGDINLKFSGNRKKGDQFAFSILSSTDSFTDFIEEKEMNQYFFESTISNQQSGVSFYYGKNWKNGALTNITFAASTFDSMFENEASIWIDKDSTDVISTLSNNTQNGVKEQSVKINHILPSTKRHHLNVGSNFIRNSTSFKQDTTKATIKSFVDQRSRLQFFAKDQIRLSKKADVVAGLKLDLPLVEKMKAYLQPRLTLNIYPLATLTTKFAYGKHYQFINENAIVDNFNNYLYFWNIENKNSILESDHFVASIEHQSNNFEWKIEGFYKRTNGLSRWFSKSNDENLELSYGKSKSRGLDLSAKKQFGKHNIWAVYTLSKTEEYFDNFSSKSYQRAPQDQRHEFKAAGIFNFKPYYFSINYVYGSGIPNTTDANLKENIPFYSRLDISALYKFNTQKFDLASGISILNVFNRKNVRYNNFSNFPDNKTTFSLATPFTPTLFVNFGF